ncbi:hypothetical protein LSCM1_03551 [Leishmania martiniquensis]|uniref:Rab-GAP TBC domain-containing protein n=1 Tax=Leishmania martiniquensis TaxID=1580590 RepID=A0A836GMW1_9TRYP|nr:hypothetical protein LSCM1_03551 [Leishmania martiniquensis]
MTAVGSSEDASSVLSEALTSPSLSLSSTAFPLPNRSDAPAHTETLSAALQPSHKAISTLATIADENGAVGFIPLCVRRLRGPGRVRRVPPGTAYRSAGALLRRRLCYSEDGEVRVEVVREVASGVRPSVGHPEGRPVAAAEEVREGHRQITSVPRASLSSQAAKHSRTRSQARRERASVLAMETERRYAAAQESRLSSLLQALPLLRVVPPQSLLQQAYTEELAAEPASQAFTPPCFSMSRNASGSTSSVAIAAPAVDSPWGVGSSSRGDADLGGRGASGLIGQNGTTTAADFHGRNPNGLGLCIAALHTPEEVTGAYETQHRRALAQPVSAAHNGGGGAGDSETSLTPLTPPSTANTTAASSIGGTPITTVHKAAFESAQAAEAAVAAALNGAFIDSGFGVTIKIGASCDEPNSLRSVAWGGCRPALLRAVVWRLLSDYAPAAVTRQKAELQRKRRQYEAYTRQYCGALMMLSLKESPSIMSPPSPLSRSHGDGGSGGAGAAGLRDTPLRCRVANARLPQGNAHRLALSSGAPSTPAVTSLSPHEHAILQQMLLDLPRHQSSIFHAGRSVAGMARCLFLWAQRHPAVGYVQGMDDVVAVFYQVFLADALRQFARESGQATANTPPCQTGTCEETRGAKGVAAAARFGSGTDDCEGDDSDGKAPSTGGAEASCMPFEKSTRGVMGLLVASLTAKAQRASRISAAASTPPVAASPIAMTTLRAPATQTTPAAALSPYLSESDIAVWFDTPAALDAVLAELPESYLTQVEGDTYWCAGRVLSLLQDNFMPGQPGILRNVRRLEALVRAVDPSLISFLEGYGLTVMDGCFQWLHCLLARELPLPMLLRLWDCYLAIGIGGDRAPTARARVSGAHTPTPSLSAAAVAQGTSASDEEIMYFHVCVCCALLRNLRSSLLGSSSPTPTPAASAAPGGGWRTATLATVFPVFGSRIPNHEGSGAPTSAADAAARAGTSSQARPPIDVVMAAMKYPFEALFPQCASEKQKRQRQSADGEANHEEDGASAQKRAPEESPPEVALQWLDILIADAYCIWRQHSMCS